MQRQSKAIGTKGSFAFTVIEILVVLIIIGFAALLAVPVFSSADDVKLRTAACIISADIEYAKNMAITTQRRYSVVFDTGDESYQVKDDTGTVINHPVRGGIYKVSFNKTTGDSRVSGIDINSANFDGAADKTLTFDSLGYPYSGFTSPPALVSGTITLRAGALSMSVKIEPVTGYVSITSP